MASLWGGGDKCVLFRIASKILSLSGSGMFLFASSNFISPPLQQSQKSNIDDWLHFITAVFIFQKNLQVHPDNGAKAEIRRVLWGFFWRGGSYLWEDLFVAGNAQELNPICTITQNERGFFCILEMLLFNSYQWQRSLGPLTQEKACFTLDPCRYPPTTLQDGQSRDQGRPGEILSPDIKKKDARRDLSPSLPGIQFHSANICHR